METTIEVATEPKPDPVLFQEVVSVKAPGEVDRVYRNVGVSVHRGGARLVFLDANGISMNIHTDRVGIARIIELLQRAQDVPEPA